MAPLSTTDLLIRYDKAADAALAALTVEEIMEAPPSATQRKITLASFGEIAEDRPDVHLFNELLVLYPDPADEDAVTRVVPDNLIVLSAEPPRVERSFNVPLQPVGIFMTFEYVSPAHLRKDYEENLIRYERHLRVPYYLLFNPEAQELILHRLDGERYVTVKPNEHGRYPIPELEMELAIHDGWVRYWFRGEMLPLPSVLRRELREAREAARRAQEQAGNATRRAEQAEADAERSRDQAAESARQAAQARQDADNERQARLDLQRELDALRRQLGQGPPTSNGGAPGG